MDAALSAHEVVKRKPAEPSATVNWMGEHETWLIAFRPEVNGYVVVEVIDAAWPDSMGDPKSDPMLFGAWSMGFFGPFAYPGNLERAVRYTRAFGNRTTADAAERHRALVCIRSSYALGARDDDKIMPEDYDARAELDFVTSVARAVAAADGALCYFNPNGETLFSAREMEEMLAACPPHLPPLPLWAAGRMVRLEDSPPWMLADVVGMQQLDALDHEICFRRDDHDANAVMTFLRNMSQYTLDSGPVIRTGNTTDGPGGIWRAIELQEPLLPAPRPVIRWYPDTGPPPPRELISAGDRPSNAPPPMPQPSRPAKPAARGLGGRLKSLFGR